MATATQSGDESCEPPGAPSPFAALNVTQQQLKRASKKRDKLARRAARAGGGGAPAPAEPVQTALGFGAFEAHTSGFGSRILRAYGFSGQGTGLGREGTGIAEPIAVARRPKSRGLGAL